METLYVTADAIGQQSGGGRVTWEEWSALKSMSDASCVCRQTMDREKGPLVIEAENEEQLKKEFQDPWFWDHVAFHSLQKEKQIRGKLDYKLAHVYAGTFSRTIAFLQANGCKVTYTAAAHDIDLSRREHEKLGIPYNYPHLTEPDLLRRYCAGYLAADVLVVPSLHSQAVMRKLGRMGRIEVIPHGVILPDHVAPLPSNFTVGYLGACGAPDKGLRYLLEAWKKLAYPDAVLRLAGRDSTSEWVNTLVRQFGGGNIVQMGWTENVAHFYDQISLYVQPSVTEGFGIEVLEAAAHSRPLICSDGAGSVDFVAACEDDFAGLVARAGSADDLCSHIDWFKHRCDLERAGRTARRLAENFTWDKIRARYQSLWKEILCTNP